MVFFYYFIEVPVIFLIATLAYTKASLQFISKFLIDRRSLDNLPADAKAGKWIINTD